MAESTDSLEILRNKVHKLNSVLAIYREKYGSLSTEPETDDNAPDVPWFVDKTMLSPLLKDYDTMIEELLKQKDSDGTDLRQLASLVKSLTEENKFLREKLERRKDNEDSGEGESSRDSSLLRVPSFQTGPSFFRDRESDTANQELEAKLKASEAELASCRWQIQELRTTLDQLRSKEKFQMPIGLSGTGLVGSDLADVQVDQLKHLLKSYEARLDGKTNQLSSMEEEKSEVIRQMENLKSRADELERIDLENLQQMTRNKQLVEDALAERDQCLFREKQAQEENTRLQELIESMVKEAGLKTREEVEKVRAEYKLKLEKSEFHLQQLRGDSSDSKSFTERLKREKMLLQEEIKALSRRLEECEASKTCGDDETMVRMFGAERSRDEALLKLSLLEDKFTALEKERTKEKEQLMDELLQVRDRLSRCNADLESITSERDFSVSEVFDLKEKILKLESNKDAAMRHLSKQLLILQQLLKTKEKEYKARIEAVEDEHRSAFVNLKESLAAQQRLASRLKEDTNSMIRKLEATVTSLRGELFSEKKDKTEALKLLKDSREKTLETESKLSSFARNIELLESKIYDAENRRSTIQSQIIRRENLTKGMSLIDARKAEMRNVEQYIKETNFYHGDGRSS